jgi:undecaprenyl-diphosphatase
MYEALQALLAWSAAHPLITYVGLFVFGVIDCLFLVGMFMPTTAALITLGAMTALGGPSFKYVWMLIWTGSVVGEMINYALGYHFGARLFQLSFLQKRQSQIDKGRLFIEKHGPKSLVASPFLAFLRPILPTTAGVYRMPLPWFVPAVSLGTFMWSFLFLGIGAVLGTSLNLAAEVASKLAALLLGSLLTLVAVYWLTTRLSSLLSWLVVKPLAWLLDFSQRHRHLQRLGAGIVDPNVPETPVLAGFALLLLAVTALVQWLVWGSGDQPWLVDQALWGFFKNYQTPWATALAVALAQLSSSAVYVPVAVGGLVALIWQQQQRAAAHWLAAVGFGAVIAICLRSIRLLPAPDIGPVPRDFILPIVIYGFIPVLLATQRTITSLIYAPFVTLLVAIGVSRLYLGVQWLSLSVFGMITSIIWLSMLGLGYRHHAPQTVRPWRFLLLTVGVLFVAGAINLNRQYQAMHQEYAPPPPVLLVYRPQDWQQGRFADLPSARMGWNGRAEQPLNVQWAGKIKDIEAQLKAKGWQSPTALTWGNGLKWLSSAPIEFLPILPQVHLGRHEALKMRLSAGTGSQYVIRLWRSGARLTDGRPIYIGNISRQVVKDYADSLRIPFTKEASAPLALLPPVQSEPSVLLLGTMP